jgi:glyoxylase I family protein
MAEISGIHHGCITVSDMERSKKWYQEVLGLKLITEFYLDVPELGTGVGVPGAQLKGAMLQHGEGENVAMIELLHYVSPIGKSWDSDVPMNNIGCTHIAFATENAIDDLYKELVGKGVKFYSPPQTIELEGDAVKFCYFKDPDGITLELIGS